MTHPPTIRRLVQVEHVAIEATKPFEAVKAALESLVPPLDPAVPEALRQSDIEQAKEVLRRGPEIAIFSARDHGGLLRIAGLARKAVQYEIGNPLTATRMTQLELPAARSSNTTGPHPYSASLATNGSPRSAANWMHSLKACWSKRPAEDREKQPYYLNPPDP